MKIKSAVSVLSVAFTLSFPLLALAQTSTDGSAKSASASSDDGLVTVYTARKIVTMDPGWPEATAVAVKDGKILSVGTLDDLKPWLDKYPHKIDKQFQNRVIYPGLSKPIPILSSAQPH
ncbi:hypothetical protein [Brucella intermedia]|uniref:hypothetical protein n=1 Tax=Brucella intermedia TaxID=94625 RepID=UPI002447124B|nr:hypothetical protein [Brucella intermedia]WGG59097.1 hypothetical protein QA414_12320 [Brucella intermedia]